MAKDVESLALCMRALLCEDMFSLDSTVPPLPFNEEVQSLQGPRDLWGELQTENTLGWTPGQSQVLLSRLTPWRGCAAGPTGTLAASIFLSLQVYSSTKPLRIGYYETDFFTMPSPAMRRAVRETKQLLEEAGHTVGTLGLLGQGDKPSPCLLTQQLLLKGKTLFSGKDGGFPVGLSGNPQPSSAHFELSVASPKQCH